MKKLLRFHNHHSVFTRGSRKIEYIPVEMIRPSPYQPRKSFSLKGLEELAQSIKQYGVIQPITVRKSSQGGYELIAGERRLRAVKMAGLDYIPAIITDAYEHDSAIMAMIENLQRENLHYLDEAKGYVSLIKDHGFTQEQLAIKLGKNQSTIANKMRILKLSNEIKEILVRENLTERHARALLRLPNNELQIKALKLIIEKKMNVRDAEAAIDNLIRQIQVNERERNSGSNHKNNPGQKKIFGRSNDIRLFINTVKNAVKMLKSYGLAVQYSQMDKGDRIEIIVSIPKMH